MSYLFRWFDVVIEVSGRMSALLIPLLVVLVVVNVTLRFVFDFSVTALLELEWYIYSINFMMAGAYAYKHMKHVRVDVIYEGLSSRWKHIIDVTGDIFFLLPWTYVVITMSEYFAFQSFSLSESSPDPGGLPALYLIKYLIPFSFVLLQMQGLQNIYHRWKARPSSDIKSEGL